MTSTELRVTEMPARKTGIFLVQEGVSTFGTIPPIPIFKFIRFWKCHSVAQSFKPVQLNLELRQLRHELRAR